MADNKPKLTERIKARFARAQERHPMLAHAVATIQHYNGVHGNVLAGAVTYFGFLSFFPILAIAFSVIGYVSIAFPDARDSLVTAIEQVFPGIVTVDGSDGTISLEQIEKASATVGTIGFITLLYTGLGWLSGLRSALTASFELPQEEQRNFFVGKAIDLMFLAVLGFVLLVSVGISGVAKGLADEVLELVGLDSTWIGPILIWAISTLLGVSASILLFFVMFRLLGKPELPGKPLWQGALIGAVGFELQKFIFVNVLGGVGGSAFAPLAIAITLLVWINYFSRLVFIGASWAVTSPLSAKVMEARREEAARNVLEEQPEPDEVDAAASSRARAGVSGPPARKRSGGFDLGSALLGGAAAAVAAALFWRHD
ncbi:MAG: YihY/virulence factor BrkB family protein, partial [Nocardioidaceae bacterium]